MNDDRVLRKQLVALLEGGEAHMPFDQAVADFPLDAINWHPENVPYTPWALLEHIRIAQWDILEFIRNPQHISPHWPEGYWPAPEKNATPEEWEHTLQAFRKDLADLKAIVEDPATDLQALMPQGEPYTILREILSVGDHNSYHIGEFAVLRQVMKTWPTEHRV